MGRHNFDLARLYGKHYVEGMLSSKISTIRNIMYVYTNEVYVGRRLIFE
jgi:hypothetical protein